MSPNLPPVLPLYLLLTLLRYAPPVRGRGDLIGWPPIRLHTLLLGLLSGPPVRGGGLLGGIDIFLDRR